MKSKILLFTCVSLLTAALCGCGQNKQQEEAVDTLVVAPNDWHGAFSRLAKIQTDQTSIYVELEIPIKTLHGQIKGVIRQKKLFSVDKVL